MENVSKNSVENGDESDKDEELEVTIKDEELEKDGEPEKEESIEKEGNVEKVEGIEKEEEIEKESSIKNTDKEKSLVEEPESPEVQQAENQSRKDSAPKVASLTDFFSKLNTGDTSFKPTIKPVQVNYDNDDDDDEDVGNQMWNQNDDSDED